MLPINDLVVWLRESAATLRANGAEASACVYAEIADQLDRERGEVVDRRRRDIVEARACVEDAGFFGPTIIEMLDSYGLAVVPRRWVE